MGPTDYLTHDQIISLALVALLLLASGVRRMLDASGLIAAMVVGLVVSLMGHWTWLAIMVVFLVLGSIATRWKFEEKRALSIHESNEGVRGWKNVLANGAAPSIVAILSWLGDGDWYFLGMACCASVALSDTLASEIGSLDPRTRSIINLEAVPPGTNGGMSPTGTFAALSGSLIIATVTALMIPYSHDGFHHDATLLTDSRGLAFVLITIVGWIGCQVDSVLGALLENKGYIGKHSVNFLATLSGAMMAFMAWGGVF
ncbi:MAG: DUF92 domain-containing protein [Candidatus Thermoplasmatota archaeon]|nr:DUF92 domain-containing protein [Candidatus Thermoplasmatota archaeon]